MKKMNEIFFALTFSCNYKLYSYKNDTIYCAVTKVIIFYFIETNMSTPVVVNFSSDAVYCYAQSASLKIPYNNLEMILPQQLDTFIKKHSPSALLLLNWPWWFTLLRIGALVVSLLAQHYKIELYDRSKPDFFSVWYQYWYIARYVRMTLGQKNTVRLYDAAKKTHKVVTLDQIPHYLWWLSNPKNYSIDLIYTHRIFNYLEKSKRVVLEITHDWLQLDWKVLWWSHRLVSIKKVTTVQPNYMIEPTLW